MRTGAFALTLLAEPLNTRILTALRKAPVSRAELDAELGTAPRRNSRRLRTLAELGILDDSDPCSLSDSGRELVQVVEALSAWLARAPAGALQLGTQGARDAMKAMADAWASGMARAMAATPLTLVELDSLLAELTYPQLERRLALMRRTGQIEACRGRTPSRGRTPYTVTGWLRRAIAPLSTAIRWERLRMAADSGAITRIDAEAAFLLAVPQVIVRGDLSGRCRLTIEVEHRAGTRPAGVMVDVVEGRVASCSSRLDDDSSASATGPAPAWLDAVIDRRPGALIIDGRPELATAMVAGLHDLLFAAAPPR